jgi:EAL domain-containing protein (putative c-di-GMP-specific phosphodiesterase class I)
MIHRIGEWMLRAVCLQLSDWQREGIAPQRVSINFSSLELTRTSFIPMVDAIIAETGINPAQLEFELTESVLMNALEVVQELLEQLRERGISLAIDDFGSGYSSLRYLSNFPIQRIKIDQSFICGIESNSKSMALIKAIIALASSLHMEIFAEGVETAEQLRFLKAHGCTEVQGHYFAHPMTAQEFQKFSPREELFDP